MKNSIQKLLAIIILIVLLPSIALCANSNQKFKIGDETPILLLGIGLSINDYGLGLGLEGPITNNLSAYGDLGLGGWGFKAGAGLNYHFQQITKGSEISAGICRGSGLENYETEMTVEPSGNKQKVKLSMDAVYTLNIKYTYNFKVGSKSKFGLSVGYAFPFSNENYKVLSPGVTLTSESKAVMKMLEPGGLIFGLRMMFGMGSRE
jgi:hypothetical protein